MKELFVLQKGVSMKSKSKNAHPTKKKEFRYHNIKISKNGKVILLRHPAYIFLAKGNVYVYVSITHSKKVNDYLVIKLRKNPNPNDNTSSFYIAEIFQDTKDKFGSRQHNWEINEMDDREIRKLYLETKKDDSVD